MLPQNDEFWQVGTPREARACLLSALRFELLGPGTADEELRESPLAKYAVGMLAPFGTALPDEEGDEEFTAGAEAEEVGAIELGPPMSQAITPSSIGLSFIVPLDTKTLTVRAKWGDYRVEEILDDAPEDLTAKPERPDDSELEPEGQKPKLRRARLRWVRTPRDSGQPTIELKPNAGLQRLEVVKGDGVMVEHLCRTLGNRLTVSVFLVNRRRGHEKTRPQVDAWVFQPELRIQAQAGEAVFIPRELEPALAHSDRDRESNRLLFRNRREFAIGHGCAAEWTQAGDLDRGEEVRTEVMPQYELPRVDAGAVGGRGLEMDALADARSAAELRELLTPFLDEYGIWILEKRSAIADLLPDLQPVAHSQLEDCSNALQRMRRGVEGLVHDADAFQAFRFANAAMLLQRSHSLWAGSAK